MKAQATRTLKGTTFKRWYVVSDIGKVWPTWADSPDHAASRARQNVEHFGQSIAGVLPAPMPSEEYHPIAENLHRNVAVETSAA